MRPWFAPIATALLLLAPTAWGQVRLSIFTIRDPLPPKRTLECRVNKSPAYGYLLVREGIGPEVKIYSINNNVNEGEKTMKEALRMPRGGGELYVKHFRRWENIGSYMEFLIPAESGGDSFPGNTAFTDSQFSKDETGKESEQLIPQMRFGVTCRLHPKESPREN